MDLMLTGKTEIECRRWLDRLNEMEWEKYARRSPEEVIKPVRGKGRRFKDTTLMICPVCGKKFYQTAATTNWAYKILNAGRNGYDTLCSWHCLQIAKKKKDEEYARHMAETREERSRKGKERWKTT